MCCSHPASSSNKFTAPLELNFPIHERPTRGHRVFHLAPAGFGHLDRNPRRTRQQPVFAQTKTIRETDEESLP